MGMRLGGRHALFPPRGEEKKSKIEAEGHRTKHYRLPRPAVNRNRDSTAIRPQPGPAGRSAVGAQARAPLLAGLALDVGVKASLVQGGVDYVQGHAIGAQFLELDGGDSFPATLAYLRQRAHEVEVLGHVAGDD